MSMRRRLATATLFSLGLMGNAFPQAKTEITFARFFGACEADYGNSQDYKAARGECGVMTALVNHFNATNTQTIGTTTVGSGVSVVGNNGNSSASTITATEVGVGTVNLNLGTIVHNVGGLLNVTFPAGASVFSTSNTDVGGIRKGGRQADRRRVPDERGRGQGAGHRPLRRTVRGRAG